MEETRIIDPNDTYDVQDAGLACGVDLLGGKFKIDKQIGSGGFGITYLAKDIYLDRSVVIKECFPEAFCLRFGQDVHVRSPRYENQHRKSVEMFMREARSIAKLRHPNIVGVHQVFEENQTAYMVLDLIHGRDLADIIEDEDEDLNPNQVRDILVKCLDALDLIHSHDLLHRDVSPDNILLDKWGTPALIDFGAAREEASKRTGDVSTMLVVKDGYSPHEFYIVGGKQEPCSDLYALGATIYHLIAGEAPPNSQVRLAAMTDTGEDPFVPLAGRFPQYEQDFLAAIDKALSVPPRDRIASAKDWLDLIQTEGKKVQMVHIPETRMVSKSISELVTETNRHVYTAPAQTQAPRPKPTQAQVEETFRPSWVDEFNRETDEIEEQRRRAAEAQAAAAQAAAEEAERLRRQEMAAAAAREEAARAKVAAAMDANRPSSILNWVSLGRSN
ncbi:MAG: serine/threonine protein kinase [Yoonia sp.]|uniref:serine/threonine protein kinase n=1 Tax=Yoonia sp. TaxID=2212373 RepID=UPI003EF57118